MFRPKSVTLTAEAEPVLACCNLNDQQNQDNQFYFTENPEFGFSCRQSYEPEMFHEIQFFNSNLLNNHTNDLSCSKKEIIDCNSPYNINICQKNNNQKNIYIQNNLGNETNSLSSNFISFQKNDCFQNFQLCNQNFNYNNNNKYFHQNFTNQFYKLNKNLINPKIRKKRGTGDEALRKHPNDDFNYENKPCYLFLVSISNDIFRKKCTFEIINTVANIIEKLNPSIQKRTRMERRRKHVLLFWFHNNWPKIAKMKNKIIEQLNSV